MYHIEALSLVILEDFQISQKFFLVVEKKFS